MATAQYYLRGVVLDNAGDGVPRAKLKLQSTNYIYTSGASGKFGIACTKMNDSLEISAEGFCKKTVAFDARKELQVVLQKLYSKNAYQQKDLVSITKGFSINEQKGWTVGNETYRKLEENQFIKAATFPETGFAVNTNKASYSNIRRFLNSGGPVPPDAIRIEEILNYFNLNYQPPAGNDTWKLTSLLTDCPWNTKNKLLLLRICAKKLALQELPPANLVFLIDVSGSMDMPNRLPLLQGAFRLMVDNLRPVDTISMVVYGSSVGVWLPPTSGSEKQQIHTAIATLSPGGSTAGAKGIETAYKLAKEQFIEGGNNRVILATDGDFNVGATSDKQLEELICGNRDQGIYLTCLGVGMGNYKDSKLELMAKNGKGNFAYLDSEQEAEKILLEELTQTLYAVANDVFLTLKFDKDAVESYRLVGFDNGKNALKDSLDILEGAAVGSGQALTAVFEIIPQKMLPDNNTQQLATVEMQYTLPYNDQKLTENYAVASAYMPLHAADSAARMAVSLVMFGSKLRNSDYINGFSWESIRKLANSAVDLHHPLQMEYLELIQKAKKVYGKKNKLRRKY